MITIGIFGPPDDQEVKALSARIVNRGGAARVIDLSRFPGALPVTVTPDDLIVDHHSLFDLAAAFLRKRGVTVPAYIDYEKKCTTESGQDWEGFYPDYCRYLAAEVQAQAVRNSLLDLLGAKIRLVNPVAVNDMHRKKSSLLWFLKKRGLPVPGFACGTWRDELQLFAGRCTRAGSGAVTKPLAGIYKTLAWDEAAAAAHPWNGRPAFYEQYIKGDTIRCYVLDRKLIAAAVIIHGNTVDSSLSQTGIKVITLPGAAAEIALQTARVLELDFCGLDLMQDTENNFYLIDCNFSPMFVNFSLASGIDIPALLADFLLAAACKTQKQHIKTLELLQEAKSLLAEDRAIRKKLMGK